MKTTQPKNTHGGARPGAGRPESPVKLVPVQVRLAPDEKAAWMRAAQRKRLTLSDWIRHRCGK